MIDKKFDTDMKSVKSFLEFWGEFHAMYVEVISKELITKEDESKFLETKEFIRVKYDQLKSGLELKYVPRARPTDPVSDILSLAGIRFMAEKNLVKADGDWKDSYVFLNSILERLKDKKRRLEQFNPVGVFIKRIFEK